MHAEGGGAVGPRALLPRGVLHLGLPCTAVIGLIGLGGLGGLAVCDL